MGPFGSVAEDEQARVTSFEDAGGCADQCPEVLLLREPSDGEQHRRLPGSEPWMIERLVRHRAQLRGDDGVVHDLDMRRPQSRRMDEVVGRALGHGHDTIGPRVEAPDQPRHLAMAAAGRMRRLERERVLLVHDQPRVHAGERPGPDADDVDVVHRREHRGRALAAEVANEAREAREHAFGSEVHDPDRVGNFVEVVALGSAEDQVDVVAMPRDPSGQLEHRPLGPAAVHVGGEDGHPLLRDRRHPGRTHTIRTTLRSRRHTVRRIDSDRPPK